MTHWIDGDHLKAWILARWEEKDAYSAYPLKAIEILDQIDREIEYPPEVDAIPIEYIREHMNGFYDHGYNEFGSALEALIMDWEEENHRSGEGE